MDADLKLAISALRHKGQAEIAELKRQQLAVRRRYDAEIKKLKEAGVAPAPSLPTAPLVTLQSNRTGDTTVEPLTPEDMVRLTTAPREPIPKGYVRIPGGPSPLTIEPVR